MCEKIDEQKTKHPHEIFWVSEKNLAKKYSKIYFVFVWKFVELNFCQMQF